MVSRCASSAATRKALSLSRVSTGEKMSGKKCANENVSEASPRVIGTVIRVEAVVGVGSVSSVLTL